MKNPSGRGMKQEPMNNSGYLLSSFPRRKRWSGEMKCVTSDLMTMLWTRSMAKSWKNNIFRKHDTKSI